MSQSANLALAQPAALAQSVSQGLGPLPLAQIPETTSSSDSQEDQELNSSDPNDPIAHLDERSRVMRCYSRYVEDPLTGEDTDTPVE